MRIATVLLAVAVARAEAKPKSVRAEDELEASTLIAEVSLLEIKNPTNRKCVIRVRVTTSARGILRGFEQAGRELVIRPTPGGWNHCAATLQHWKRAADGARRGRKNRFAVLLAIDKNKTIRLAGLRDAQGYNLRAFYDFNACWIFPRDKAFGTHVRKYSVLAVPGKNIAALARKERTAFLARAARVLLRERPPIPDKRIEALARQLRAPDRDSRMRAHAALVAEGAISYDKIRLRMKEERDPEVRRRFEAVLRALAPYRSAIRVAEAAAANAAAGDRADAIHILRGGIPGLDETAAATARRKLEELRILQKLTRSAPKDVRTPK